MLERVEYGTGRAGGGTRGDKVGVGGRGRSGAFGGHREGGKEEEEEKHGMGNI